MDDTIVSYRGDDGFVSVATYHPIQLKLGYDRLARRWHLFIPRPVVDTEQVRIDWQRHIHPFATKGEALAAAYSLLPDCLQAYEKAKRQPLLTLDSEMTRDKALEVLGLGPSASRDDINKQYRKLAMAVHPDVGGSAALIKQLNIAMAVLRNG